MIKLGLVKEEYANTHVQWKLFDENNVFDAEKYHDRTTIIDLHRRGKQVGLSFMQVRAAIKDLVESNPPGFSLLKEREKEVVIKEYQLLEFLSE